MQKDGHASTGEHKRRSKTSKTTDPDFASEEIRFPEVDAVEELSFIRYVESYIFLLQPPLLFKSVRARHLLCWETMPRVSQPRNDPMSWIWVSCVTRHCCNVMICIKVVIMQCKKSLMSILGSRL